MSDTLRYVRIIKIPVGDAPKWVRHEWVGLVLPDLGPAESGGSWGILTGRFVQHDGGCRVPMRIAIDRLAGKCPEAAQWFVDHLGTSRIRGGIFIFRSDECEAVPELEAAH